MWNLEDNLKLINKQSRAEFQELRKFGSLDSVFIVSKQMKLAQFINKRELWINYDLTF